EKRIGYGVMFGLSFSGSLILTPDVQAFSLDGAAYLLPFFVLGAWACSLSQFLGQHRGSVAIALGVATGGLILLLCLSEPSHLNDVFQVCISALFLILIYITFPRIHIIACIGVYSFSIYLFHSIFIALGVRLPGAGETPAFLALVV